MSSCGSMTTWLTFREYRDLKLTCSFEVTPRAHGGHF